MKSLFGLAAMAFMSTAAWAGGIDRSGQGLGGLFESGNYLEASLSHAMPRVEGADVLGGSTGNVAGNFYLPSFSIKFDANDTLSLGLIVDQTYGADILYGEGARLLGGTRVEVASYAMLGLVRYRLNDYFSLHGGWRTQNSSALVRLKGLAYGPVNGYEVKLHADTAAAPVAGMAFEYPVMALRLVATYHHAIKHQFNTNESAPLSVLNGSSTTEISTPRAVNIDFQTGVAESTLIFGRLRWVKWSEFRVDPALFMALTGEGLIELKSTRTWTLGIAHQFTKQWGSALSFDYEKKGDPLNSPLAPVNGRSGVMLAAIYSQDRIRVSAGVSYTRLGDAKLETGTPDVHRATMSGNSTIGLGVKVGWAF